MDRVDARHSGISPADANLAPLQVVWMSPISGYEVNILIGENGAIYLKDEYHIRAINSDGNESWSLPSAYGSFALAHDGTIRVITSSEVTSLGPDGAFLWSVTIPGLNSVLAAPVIDKNDIVYGPLDNRSSPDLIPGIVAVSPEGTIRWTFESAGIPGLSIAIADDGTVLFTTSIYGGSSYLYAINPNGTLKWRSETSSGWMSGRLAVGGDGSIYLTDGNSMQVFGSDGSYKWSFQRSEFFPSPCIGDDIVIVSSDQNVTCLALSGNEMWTYNTHEDVTDQLMMKNGSLMLITRSSVIFLDGNGTLETSARIFETSSSMHSLWNPIIDSDGTIYLIFFGEGSYLVKLGAAPEHPELTARILELTIFLPLTVGLSVIAAIILIIHSSRRKNRKTEGLSDLIPWLWLSIGLRVVGAFLGLIALGLIWQYRGIGGSGYYVNSLYGYDGRDLISLFNYANSDYAVASGAIGVLAFLISILLSLLTWRMAYLGLVGLLAYYGTLLDYFDNGGLLLRSDLSVGLPFGDGYILAWISLVLIFLSGMIWLYAKREPSILFVGKPALKKS
jgi:outer membrane protein assembly factor BamB